MLGKGQEGTGQVRFPVDWQLAAGNVRNGRTSDQEGPQLNNKFQEGRRFRLPKTGNCTKDLTERYKTVHLQRTHTVRPITFGSVSYLDNQ